MRQRVRVIESFRVKDSTRIKLEKLIAKYEKELEFPPKKGEIYNRAIEEFCKRELGSDPARTLRGVEN